MMQRHAPDVVALVAGTIFAGFTAVWLLILSDVIEMEQASLGGPAILIVAGVLGLAVALSPNRKDEPAPALATLSEPADPTTVIPAVDDETTPLDSIDQEPQNDTTDDETDPPEGEAQHGGRA